MSAIQNDFTFSIFYNITDIIVTDNVYFQFVVEFINSTNEK